MKKEKLQLTPKKYKESQETTTRNYTPIKWTIQKKWTNSFIKNLFILFYLFLAALGHHCCVWAFSSCGEWGLLFVAVRRFLIVVASLVAEHRLQAHVLRQLWHAGSVVVAHGLSCSTACGIFLDQGSNPCPLHWQAYS